MRYGMLIDLNKCVGCNACTVACRNNNGTPAGVSLHKLLKYEAGVYPNAKMKFRPMPCMHCQDAPCAKVCPTGATVQRPDGIVDVDANKCIGCRSCITACPYDSRQFIWDFGDYYEQAQPTRLEQKRRLEFQKGTMVKCTFCLTRLQQGKVTDCTATCPSQCRVFGDLDDPNSEVSRAIVDKGARPFREELETHPSVYYAGG